MLARETAAKPYVALDTVLVVDDDPVIVSLLAKVLDRYGYNVLTANCAQEALEILESNPVRLVVSDIQMPETDGLVLTRNLKALVPDLPVLLMTGDRTRYCDQDALRAGADGFITKPFAPSTLLEMIESLIK